MTSANDTPGGDFDERLAQALDAALAEGEQLVAKETGDQGQAIALTKTRILVAKAGFAATGELNSHKVSAFDLQSVTAVNLRKGPLGAVIQICAETSDNSAQNGTPDNVVVFTGPGRVKRAEAFAAQVEFLAGKQVNRVEPSGRPDTPPIQEAAAPPKSKGGRKPSTLAEEIYSEVVEAGKNPAPQTEAPAQPVVGTVQQAQPVVEPEPEEETPEPKSQYRPNPNIPKPIRKNKRGPSGVLVLLGVAGALVLIGMAVMAPSHQSQNSPSVVSDPNNAAAAKLTKDQLGAVSKYKTQIAKLVAQAEAEAAALRSAVRTGNKAAAKAVGEAGKTDAAMSCITTIAAPPGMAEAKGDIASGLLTQKTAIAAASAAAQTSGSMPASQTVTRLDEAGAQIRRGMSMIVQAQSRLGKQTAASTAPKQK